MVKYLKQHPKWNNKDYWPTIDERAVSALFPFIYDLKYGEPCWGGGHLENLISTNATCVWRSDIDPQQGGCVKKDAKSLRKEDLKECDVLITNPPFSWELLKPLLDHLPKLKPTWLLLPADKLHTKQMAPYLNYCEFIVSIGRLKFFFDNDERLWDSGKGEYKKNSDPTINFVWCMFDNDFEGYTKFFGRDIGVDLDM